MAPHRWVFPLLGFLAIPLLGQDQNDEKNRNQYRDSRFELFMGYSYRGTKISAPSYYLYLPSFVPLGRWENANGWALGVTYKFHRHIGVAADLAGQYGRALSPIVHAVVGPGGALISPERHNFASYQFLFGPAFSLRSGRVTEFAHTLAGAFNSAGGAARTDFAMAIGGGVDVRLTDRISVRAFQVDWIPVKTGGWEHHVRFQTGIIFNFGR